MDEKTGGESFDPMSDAPPPPDDGDRDAPDSDAAPESKVPSSGDRRGSPRVALMTEVGLSTDTQFYAGFSEDLSDGGLFVATYKLLAVGTRVALSLTLPDGHEIRAFAKVAWTRESPHSDLQPGMGLAFDELGDSDREAVLRFVSERPPMFYDV